MSRQIMARAGVFSTLCLLVAACGGDKTINIGDVSPPPDSPANQPPVVKIDLPSLDVAVMELSTITLSAKGSSDPDDDELTFSWKQTAGPEVVLSGEGDTELSVRLPKVRNAEEVEFGFELTVSDDNGNSVTGNVEFDLTVFEANGLLYAAAEENGNRDDVYFYHPALEQPVNLSAGIAPETAGGVVSLAVLPDHRHVAFVYASDGTRSLHIAALDGSEVRDVTGPVVEGASPKRPLPSPDGKWLAVHGDLETDGVEELFLLPIDSEDGSDRIRISGEITASDGNPDNGEIDGDVYFHNFTWLPDSSGVVFEGDLITDRTYELFVGKLNGDRIPLGITMTGAGSSPGQFAVSPTDNIVAAIGVPENPQENEIAVFAGFADGSDPALLHRGIHFQTFRRGDLNLAWSPDGEQLGFTFHRQDDRPGYELYLVAADQLSGEAVRAVGGATADPAAFVSNRFFWAPDGERLVYTGQVQDTDRFDLYAISADSIDGADRIRIPWPDEDETDGVAMKDAVFSPDGERITFGVWNNDVEEQHELFVAPLTGEMALRISEPPLHGNPVYVKDKSIFWVDDGRSVAFIADMHQDNVYELFRSEADGSGTTRLSGSITASNGNVSLFVPSPDGTMIAFSGDLETDELAEVYVIPADAIDDSESMRLSNAFAEDLDGDGMPDGYAYIWDWVGPDPQE